MTGVTVTAVIVSAVELPSGAAVLFEVAEHDPPFLSHVAAVKFSECFGMFSKAPHTDYTAPHSNDWKWESR
jgi:hypothetical protein